MQVSPQKLTCFYWVLTVCQIYIKLITYFIKPQNNNANLGLWLTPLLPSYCLPKKKKKEEEEEESRERELVFFYWGRRIMKWQFLDIFNFLNKNMLTFGGKLASHWRLILTSLISKMYMSLLQMVPLWISCFCNLCTNVVISVLLW